MDITRYTEMLLDIREELTLLELSKTLEQLVSQASKSGNRVASLKGLRAFQPTKQIIPELRSGKLAHYGPIRQLQLSNMGLLSITGDYLADRIEQALASSSRDIALQAIHSIRVEIDRTISDINVLYDALGRFGGTTPPPELRSSKPRVLLLLQTPEQGWSIEDLQKRVHAWDMQLQTFEELTRGTRTSRRIASVSPGSIEVAITLDGWTEAAVIAIALYGVQKARLLVRQIRTARTHIASIPQLSNANKTLEQEEETVSNGEIDRTVKELVGHIPEEVDDNGRRNELAIAIRKAVEFIDKRTSEGDAVEIQEPHDIIAETATEHSQPVPILPPEKSRQLVQQANNLSAQLDRKPPKAPELLPDAAGASPASD